MLTSKYFFQDLLVQNNNNNTINNNDDDKKRHIQLLSILRVAVTPNFAQII